MIHEEERNSCEDEQPHGDTRQGESRGGVARGGDQDVGSREAVSEAAFEDLTHVLIAPVVNGGEEGGR